MKYEMLIENKGVFYEPLTIDGVTWTTERRGTPGKLNFTVVKDGVLNFTEGNNLSLKVDGANVFHGYAFSKKRDKQQHIEVTAYDQMRYLANEDTGRFENKTASEILQMLAADFDLKLGAIASTSHKIATRTEDTATLFDVIYTALDLELTNSGKMYVLYDDFGALTLKSLDDMKLDLIIDEETGENFDYTSSIDDNTYNKIKLAYENEETGKRDIYVVQDGQHINDWGVLQYVDTLQKGENGEAKANALLSLYNAKTRKLKISKAFGDVRVRAGTLVIVKLALGDVNVSNYMLVEKAVHTFGESTHFMDLTLRGGSFVG